MNKNKFYITGGAGFIGRHFNDLINSSSVINFDLRSEKKVPNQILGDIRNEKEVADSIGDSNIILHLAASHYDFEKDYFETNVNGTRNLLRVASKNDIKRFIFFSSVAVYGDREKPADETTPPSPSNDYGKSKLEAESLIKGWLSDDESREAVIIRPAVVFGPHNYGNLFNLTRSINKGYNFHIGKKPAVKSTAYVENLVNATMFLIDNLNVKRHLVYNYADEPHLTNSDISKIIAQTLGLKKQSTIPYTLALALGTMFDLLSNLMDKEVAISAKRVKKYCTPTHFLSKRILEEGFNPEYDTREGLINTTEWIKNNRSVWEEEFEQLKKLFKANFGITLE